MRLLAPSLVVLAGLSALSCNNGSGGGSGVTRGANNVQLSSTDNGGGGYTITVTGVGLGALGVRGISFDLRLLSAGAQGLVSSAAGAFFPGGSVGAGFGTSPTVLHVGAGVPPANAASSSDDPQTMLTLQLNTAVPVGSSAKLLWRVENLQLFDADPGGAFAMQIPPNLFTVGTILEVTVTG